MPKAEVHVLAYVADQGADDDEWFCRLSKGCAVLSTREELAAELAKRQTGPLVFLRCGAAELQKALALVDRVLATGNEGWAPGCLPAKSWKEAVRTGPFLVGEAVVWRSTHVRLAGRRPNTHMAGRTGKRKRG